MSVSAEVRRRCAPNGNQMATARTRLRKSTHDSGCLGQVLPAANGWDLSVEKNSVPSILVRGLESKTIRRLKKRARFNGRSLQQEVKEILERTAGILTMNEARRLSERWRHRLDGRSFSDSVRLIREDRDSR